MKVFTIQESAYHYILGTYKNLAGLIKTWPDVVVRPERYVILEHRLGDGVLNEWRAEMVDGKIIWKVVGDH
jgi:hypothetical protein